MDRQEFIEALLNTNGSVTFLVFEILTEGQLPPVSLEQRFDISHINQKQETGDRQSQ